MGQDSNGKDCASKPETQVKDGSGVRSQFRVIRIPKSWISANHNGVYFKKTYAALLRPSLALQASISPALLHEQLFHLLFLSWLRDVHDLANDAFAAGSEVAIDRQVNLAPHAGSILVRVEVLHLDIVLAVRGFLDRIHFGTEAIRDVTSQLAAGSCFRMRVETFFARWFNDVQVDVGLVRVPLHRD